MPIYTPYLFVYGSLQSFSRHPMAHWLHKRSHFVGKGFFYGKLYDVGEYPAAITAPSHSSHKVLGEIYDIQDPTIWDTLDEYEGFDPQDTVGSLYIREQHSIQSLEPINSLSSWIYVYNRPIHTLSYISSGDYYSYLQQKT